MTTGPSSDTPLSVLIIDDEPSIRVTLSVFLRAAGYDVDAAEDATHAEALLEQRHFDIVLTDIVLPRVSGVELLRRIRERWANTLVLIMTGEPTVETAVEAVRAGAHDYLIKPVNKEMVLRHVGQAARVSLLLADKRRLEAANADYQENLERLVRERTKSLRDSEARLRLALDAAVAVAWDADLTTGALTEVGPVDRVFGLAPGARHATVAEAAAQIHPDDRAEVDAEVARAAAGDGHFSVVCRIVATDGSLRWLLSQGRVRSDGDGRPVHLMGIGRDVTEHHLMRASLAQSDRLATMGMLAAGVAHEINNPLSYLLFHLESLVEELPGWLGADAALPAAQTDDADEGPAGVLRRAEEALQGAERIRQISRSLGAFSRVEETQCLPVVLHNAIEHACRMAQNEVKYRARLVCDLALDLPMVLATEGKLAQVFLNLLVNAAHAMDERNVKSNQVVVRTWRDGDLVRASVRDTGRGISPEVLPRVFEPFFTTKPVGVGSGLGLPICRDIMTSFGGGISVSSEPGMGTTFDLWLPAAQADSAPAAAAAARDPRTTAVAGRVLVVDDDDTIRHILGRVVRRSHTVVEVDSGAAAQRAIDADPAFDAILCDVMMPGMLGIDLHAWLTECHADLADRVIFVSGGAFTQRARDYLSAVGNTCLAKPCEPDAVKLATDQMVERVRREQGEHRP